MWGIDCTFENHDDQKEPQVEVQTGTSEREVLSVNSFSAVPREVAAPAPHGAFDQAPPEAEIFITPQEYREHYMRCLARDGYVFSRCKECNRPLYKLPEWAYWEVA